ncbi:cation:proton antiporter [[Limnothrix rosea] IAM M-220]|uniref:cation:proton antiporter domain-containing protein n=1 Tax=[Limnothrix rosea] IAM M-220 TaxID=454133 RepID=UPI0009590982|nr:cation:proton antiporter [[Limnothrix rosea] IAM M-220]OKH18419.1 sodium:proton antiporter [[Limnothrix rosea] IAM M-220]
MDFTAIVIVILLGGFLGGKLLHRLGLPSLLGMILVGLCLGGSGLNWLTLTLVENLSGLRAIAVMVILMRAGLGLDQDKLKQQGSVAIRLGILPGLCEMLVVAVVTVYWFQWDWLTGLLLGSILSAESPAVIVPAMLKLKSQGWGVKKGIPDAILTGSALSDAVLLLIFSLLLSRLTQDTGPVLTGVAIAQIPLQAIGQIIGGVVVGWCTAKLLLYLLTIQKLTRTSLDDTLVTTCVALGLIFIAHKLPYFSGYLAVMALGFFLAQFDPPLARQLRRSFNHFWAIASIFLFVLLGASIPVGILQDIWLAGVGLLLISLLCGRSIGWWLSTLGSNWTPQEKLFLLPGNSAKATVQAAIGAIPFSMGIEHGDIILAIAALSILITAPLGAWATPLTAPKLLTKDTIDPTKVLHSPNTTLLAAIDTSSFAIEILKKTADLARRTDAKVIVLHVINHPESQAFQQLKQKTQQHLSDIPYIWLTPSGTIPEAIVEIALTKQVTAIVIGKQGLGQRLLMGSVSQAVLETSPIPVTVVAAP